MHRPMCKMHATKTLKIILISSWFLSEMDGQPPGYPPDSAYMQQHQQAAELHAHRGQEQQQHQQQQQHQVMYGGPHQPPPSDHDTSLNYSNQDLNETTETADESVYSEQGNQQMKLIPIDNNEQQQQQQHVTDNSGGSAAGGVAPGEVGGQGDQESDSDSSSVDSSSSSDSDSDSDGGEDGGEGDEPVKKIKTEVMDAEDQHMDQQLQNDPASGQHQGQGDDYDYHIGYSYNNYGQYYGTPMGPRVKKRFPCECCRKRFKSSHSLNKHLGQKAECKDFYKENGILPNEIDRSNDEYGVQQAMVVFCKKCNRGFSSDGSLNRHISKSQPCKDHYDSKESGMMGASSGGGNSNPAGGPPPMPMPGLTPRQSYYQRNREKVIERQRAYYRRNAVKVRQKRIELYRSRTSGMLDYDGMNRSGYLERHKDYYEKNKDVIREKRRNYYQSKKMAVNQRVGKSEFAVISERGNLAEIPDPFEALGVVKIEHIPPPLPSTKVIQKSLNESDNDESDNDDENNVVGKGPKQSVMGTCENLEVSKIPGGSKIDHDDEEGDDLITMPVGATFSGSFFDYDFVNCAESFVGLTLSNDDESIEVCQLLHRNDITLSSIRRLVHAVLAVLSIDFKTFIMEKPGPVALFEAKHMHLLRDKLTRDLQKRHNQRPEPSPPTCHPMSSNERQFISEDMTDEIGHEQLLVNEELKATDLGAVGIQWRDPSDLSVIRINPLFSLNSGYHWRNYMRHFYTLLVNWVGGKVLLNQIFHMLPCTMTAVDSFFFEIKFDCHIELMKPMETKICEHCGESFHFGKYTLKARRGYKRHVQLHELSCKICGESFPNGTQRKFHERSHKECAVKCPKENCHYVGSSQQAVDTHIKHAHSMTMCDLCGKEIVSQNLKLHMNANHAPKTLDFICAVCGKGYSTKNILDKHVRRHDNPDSLINKWMNEQGEFKFECKEHENCKRYFKSAKRLREHLRKYGGRPYPANLARQYVPNLPENFEAALDSTNIDMNPPAKQKRERKSLKEAGNKLPRKQSMATASSAKQPGSSAAPTAMASNRFYKKRKKTFEEADLDKKLKEMGMYKPPMPQRDPHTGRFLKGLKADHRYTIGQGDTGGGVRAYKKRDRSDHSDDYPLDVKVESIGEPTSSSSRMASSASTAAAVASITGGGGDDSNDATGYRPSVSGHHFMSEMQRRAAEEEEMRLQQAAAAGIHAPVAHPQSLIPHHHHMLSAAAASAQNHPYAAHPRFKMYPPEPFSPTNSHSSY